MTPKPARKLSHLDAKGRPAMVDVSAKAVTAREAVAECRVKFPAAVAAQLRASGLKSAKGGIVETAIIAGTMAVKRTHELIPFCHPLPIDGVRIGVDWHGERERSEEHTAELQSLMRTSYAVFCLKKKNNRNNV